jgi:hypothetical protein
MPRYLVNQAINPNVVPVYNGPCGKIYRGRKVNMYIWWFKGYKIFPFLLYLTEDL